MSFYCLLEWVIYGIDCILRAFFWKDNKDIHGGFAWLIGNLFALIKIKEVWEFVIYGPSILPSYPNGGGAFFMIHILRGWLLYFIIIIDEEGFMICTVLFPGMSPLFVEESSRLPWILPPTSILKWGTLAWQDFGSIIGWVMLHLLSYSPIYSYLPWIDHHQWTLKLAFLKKELYGLLILEDGHTDISATISLHISNW